MSTIKAQGQALKTALEAITTLKAVYSPDIRKGKYSVFPCAVINVGKRTYPEDGKMGVDWFPSNYVTFKVAVLLANTDIPTKFNEIIDFYESEGDESVRAAVMTDPTLGGTCARAWVVSSSGDSWVSVGGILYLAAEFEIEVWQHTR